jgi:hypothetical protein
MRLKVSLLAVLLAVVLVGCDGLSDQSGGSYGTGDHSVRVVNNAGIRICYLFLSPPDESSWGTDVLGQYGVLNVGSSFIIRVEEPGTYDAMAVLDRNNNCNEEGLPQVEERGLDVEGEITWTINAP